MKLSEALQERQGDRSLRAIAAELDVAPGTVEAWLKGWRSPQLHHIPRIARFLGVEVGEVVLMALGDLDADKGVYLSSDLIPAA